MRIKGWKGPLPPKRFTPLAVFGDFIGIAKRASDRAGGGSSSPAFVAQEADPPRFEPTEAGSAA
jgi:hypothetical protein